MLKNTIMKLAQHPFFAMAFRPLYPLAAIYGAISVLLWAFGYQGTAALPSHFWHAHEMIWGYSGAIAVAFLLTAVATWTGQPAIGKERLVILVLLWLASRLFAFIPVITVLSGVLGVAFYWYAGFLMWQSVYAARSQRNYIAALALFVFGLTQAAFHVHLWTFSADGLSNNLVAGLVMMAGFIGLIGSRIIAFFTSRRLNSPQPPSPMWLMFAPLVLPIIMAILMVAGMALPLAGFLGIICGSLGLIQVGRWYVAGVEKEPLLWTLHLGYAFTSTGLIVLGTAPLQHITMTLGVHLIAVGGIGLLTISMMTRTALGHTGRSLYPAPNPMPFAFICMAVAAIIRALAAVAIQLFPTVSILSMRLSGVLFAVALLLYAYRYLPWLMSPRIDGKAG